jgi:YVTN family beta-propeller protein
MTIWPADKSQPNASSLNYVAGQPPTPNAVTVALSADGRIRAFNERGSVNVIIDIAGFYQTATGTANRITNRQIAMLQWHQDPGRAATIPVGPQSAVFGVAFDGTDVWVAYHGANTALKINPATNTVTATVPVGTQPNGVAFDGTNVWVTNYGSDTVSRMNPATGGRVDHPTGDAPVGVAFDGTNMWVANQGSNTVAKMIP